jgi:hypothetical protein
MPPPEFHAPDEPGDDEVAEPDELAPRRARRFTRPDPPRYGCPTCGAHAEMPGLCLVCGSDVTQLIDEHGHLLPPP